jgi:hypothetical protein
MNHIEFTEKERFAISDIIEDHAITAEQVVERLKECSNTNKEIKRLEDGMNEKVK